MDCVKDNTLMIVNQSPKIELTGDALDFAVSSGWECSVEGAGKPLDEAEIPRLTSIIALSVQRKKNNHRKKTYQDQQAILEQW